MSWLTVMLRFALMIVLFGALLFGFAGRFDIASFWTYDVGRFHWSEHVPFPLQAGSFIALAVCLGIWALAMHETISSPQ